MMLDEAYRRAHLPLLAPDHSDVIAQAPGYAMGLHPPSRSLVLPVEAANLETATAFQELAVALHAAPFAHKIDWDLLRRRRSVLHATLCSALTAELDQVTLDRLRRIEPFQVELRGPFSGNVNLGRLYLRVYPESRYAGNPLAQIQQACGRIPTDMWVVGIWNLTDHLTTGEARHLAVIMEQWWDRPILRFTVDRLWQLTTTNDLVLGDHAIEEVALSVPLNNDK